MTGLTEAKIALRESGEEVKIAPLPHLKFMTKEIYNKFYKIHGASIHADPERFLAISKLCKGSVLDLGCGTGDLADFYKGYYTGIDVSDEAIRIAKEKKIGNAVFDCDDVTKKDTIGGGPYDTIVIAQFLEHIIDDKVLFENITRWSKHDTRIIITVPNGEQVPDPNHVRQFTVPGLRKRFMPDGKVRFHNWSGFKNRILMTIDLGQKNENMISLVEIIKNEEVGLEDSILSCINFVDNIVISIDSESKDKSEEIAKKYADVLKQHIWQDDFAAARNSAQAGVKTKWILCLDGHEYVQKYDDIAKALSQDVDGLMVKVNMEASDSFYTNRIYRSGIDWQYAIHNSIPTPRFKKYNGLTIRHNILKGQSKEAREIRTKQRDEMMPRRLEEEYKKDKKNLRVIFYLARWSFTKRQPKKALRLYKKYLRKGTIKGEVWHCCWEASVCANSLGKHNLALKFLRKANEVVPNRWEISKQMGLTYMCFEYWQKAAECLVDSFKINKGDFSHSPEKKNIAETWDQIGFCFFQIKRYKQAKIAWEESIKNDKDKIRIRLNKQRIELIDREINF